MADVTDPLMDLTDAIVAALAAGTFSSAFTAQWKDDALTDLDDADLLTTQVWAVDVAESLLPAWESSASQHGVPIEEFIVLLVVQRKFADDDDRPALCRQISALVAEITQFCRRTAVEGAVCVKTVRNPARNLKDYHTLDRFYCEIQTTWRRVSEIDYV